MKQLRASEVAAQLRIQPGQVRAMFFDGKRFKTMQANGTRFDNAVTYCAGDLVGLYTADIAYDQLRDDMRFAVSERGVDDEFMIL